MKLKIDIPDKVKELFIEKKRIRILRGGRGSGKSWSIARMCLLKAAERKRRILCTRELQASIKDSVHRLLCNQVEIMGLQSIFDYGESYIRCKNGSDFIFKGLKHNIAEIKSTEDIDICWIEEGQTTSTFSLETLLPTIRKADSEIWITYNPMNKNDPIHLLAENPPDDCVVVDMNYYDNPFFTQELEQERLRTLNSDPDKYDWIWEGKCLEITEGTYYGDLIKQAEKDGRICNVPYDPACEVITAWDLGIGDSTAIWFFQLVGQEIHLIDYYENSGVGLEHYVKVMREKPYTYAEAHLFPHDAKAKELGTGKSREEVLKTLGINCTIVARLSIDDGINAVRNILPRCWFDKEKCSQGIEALKSYQRDFNKKLNEYSNRPLHDWSSHAADAFRYLAIGYDNYNNTLDLDTLEDLSGYSWQGV